MPVSATLRTADDLLLIPNWMKACLGEVVASGRWSTVSRRHNPIDLSIQSQAVLEGHSALPSISAPKATARTEGRDAVTASFCKCSSSAGVRRTYRSVDACGLAVSVAIRLASSAATWVRPKTLSWSTLSRLETRVTDGLSTPPSTLQ